MRSAWLLMLMAFVLGTSDAALSQALNTPALDALNAERPVRADEIPTILAAVRNAVAGKTCRLSYVPNGPGPEVLMGPNGRPQFVRSVSGYDDASQQTGHVDVVTFTEYTGRLARKCDGTSLDDELVIEYDHKSTNDRWTVKARTRTVVEFAAPLFDMLSGVTPVESGDRRQFDDRVGRALVAPWKLPAGAAQSGGPLPAGIRQSLWIDTGSLLPLRWSIAVPAMPDRGAIAIPDYGLSFTYDASVDLRPPDATLATDCVR